VAEVQEAVVARSTSDLQKTDAAVIDCASPYRYQTGTKTGTNQPASMGRAGAEV